MNLWSAIGMGFKEIMAHKFRSLLSMLGIILGVSSLVGMSALVKGMEVGMREALIAIGGLEKIRVEPQDVPIEQRHLMDQAVGVTINDVIALQNSAPLVTRISPEMRGFGIHFTANGKVFRPFNCVGVWPVALEMSEHVIAHGRMFNEIDDEMARSVCVIGTMTRDELFGSPEKMGKEIIPIGETIYINRQPFTIIGMFQHYESEAEKIQRELKKSQAKDGQKQSGPNRSRGWGGGNNFVYRMKNGTVFMPLNTMWMKLRSGGGGGRQGWGTRGVTPAPDAITIPDPRLSNLELKIDGIDSLTPALQQIHNVLMSTHKGIEDFTFRTQEEWAESITTFIQNARMSRGLISAISLLVGGIGIMNIMLASISERVREIGIRKAVGANTSDVFIQIMVESVVISVLGGIAGLAASFALVSLLGHVSPSDNKPIITMASMAIAFGYSVAIGLIAGLIPAIKASRLHPIQALRYD
jgi:putative ABC transport system permease protein